MIGQVVGQYKITEKVGEGGMGAVFKGVDLMVEREVAIKMLRPDIAKQPELVERFRSEAVTLAKLNNPGIATLYNFFRQGDDFFMVMEFVSGHTLENIIRTSGAMPWDRALPLFLLILEGIQPAHNAGILHRDIKPANIMVTNWGGIKVMDFGIARVLGSARMTREGRMVGTIEYIAPERIKGNEADVRADIYSLGVVLYEMLSGRLPFESPSEYEIMRGHLQDPPPPFAKFSAAVPGAIEQVVMKSLAKAPEQRFQSCSEFIVALQTAAQYCGGLRPRTDPNATIPAPVVNYQAQQPAMVAPDISNRPTEAGGVPPPAVAEPKATRYEPQFQAPVYPPQQLPQQPYGGTGGYPAQPGYGTGGYPAQPQQQPYGGAGGYPAQPQYPGYQQGMPPPGVAPVKPPLLASLNWKHYTAAGGVVALLLGGLMFAFMGGDHGGGGQVPDPNNKPPVVQDAPPPPVQTAPQPRQSPPLNPAGDSSLGGPIAGKPPDTKTGDLSGIALPDPDEAKAKARAAKAREEAAARARAQEADRKRKLEEMLNSK